MINIKQNIRFFGEFNNLNLGLRQLYLHNVDKQDNLNYLKREFSKGEYSILINNFGKAIESIYKREIPKEYVHSYWIDNLRLLESFEKGIISFDYNDNYKKKHIAIKFEENIDFSRLNDIGKYTLFTLSCKTVNSGISTDFLSYTKYQKVTLFDEDASETVDAIICNDYVDNYKWKYGLDVKLLGFVLQDDLLIPDICILSIDYIGDVDVINVELEKSKRNSSEYEYWRKRVLERDKVCQCCGSSESLEVHHIFNYKNYVYERINEENGIVLCRECHNKYHKEYGAVATPVTMFKFIKEYGVRGFQ